MFTHAVMTIDTESIVASEGIDPCALPNDPVRVAVAFFVVLVHVAPLPFAEPVALATFAHVDPVVVGVPVSVYVPPVVTGHPPPDQAPVNVCVQVTARESPAALLIGAPNKAREIVAPAALVASVPMGSFTITTSAIEEFVASPAAYVRLYVTEFVELVGYVASNALFDPEMYVISAAHKQVNPNPR